MVLQLNYIKIYSNLSLVLLIIQSISPSLLLQYLLIKWRNISALTLLSYFLAIYVNTCINRYNNYY